MAANKSKISRMDRLYLDEGGFDFIGRAKTWYAITAGLLIVAIAAIAIRGFTLSLDFEGGTKVSLPAANLEEQAVGEVFEEATGVEPEQVQIVGSGNSATLEVNSERLTEEQADAARLAIYEEFEPVNAMGESTPDAVGVSTVSESWGSTITQRMVIAMIVFLVIATAYVGFRLQRTMAIAAILALIADGVIIAGLYALFGLEVSPAVIIGLLTVLTFSIYDSVIVFDKVNENTEGITGQRNRTYAEQTNLAINQTVMRSISTSVISALPIVALFIVAVWMMGIGTLRDLALIQLIGVIEGIFSSIFLASPLVVSLANRSKKIQQHNKDVAEYRASAEFMEEQEAGAGSDSDQGTKRQVVSPTKQATNLEGTQANRTGSSWRPGR